MVSLFSDKKIVLFSIVVGSNLLTAFGQLLFKYGLLGGHFNIPSLAGGCVVYGVSSLAYLYVLSKARLSWTFGVGGVRYIFAVVLAVVVLSENVTLLNWLGVIVIAIGTALIGVS